MTLNPSALAELRRAVAGLVAERALIDEGIAAIRRVLAHYDTAEFPQRVPLAAPADDQQPAKTDKYAGMTMREVVSVHLRAHPGWKAADVTRVLRLEGYSRAGATRFSHRVYNEIWRMERDGLVTKNEHGGFHLKE
ncbi:MAG TPA: hypothetical protein VNJ02_07245 [Vicinamibacterales bacterium]|nr:hypothetical protein [Vicinamibacterales bacterium]